MSAAERAAIIGGVLAILAAVIGPIVYVVVSHLMENSKEVNEPPPAPSDSSAVTITEPANGTSTGDSLLVVQIDSEEVVQSSELRLSGLVFDDELDPISQAKIEITGGSESTYSDDHGYFDFALSHVESQRLRVLITKNGFRNWSKTFETNRENIHIRAHLTPVLPDSLSIPLETRLMIRLVTPPRKTRLERFYMGTTEISNAQYCEFLNDVRPNSVVDSWIDVELYESRLHYGASGRYITRFPKLPIVSVSWYGAKEFCDWLSRRMNLHVSLPTAEQWEFVAKTYYSVPGIYDRKVYKFSQNLMNVDNAPTTSLPFHNVFGNVSEWCLGNNPAENEQPVRGGAYRPPIQPILEKSRLYGQVATYPEDFHIYFTDKKRKAAKMLMTGFRIAVKVDHQLKDYVQTILDVTKK